MDYDVSVSKIALQKIIIRMKISELILIYHAIKCLIACYGKLGC